MGRHTTPKSQMTQLSPSGKGRHKTFVEVERRVDRANVDAVVAKKGIMATAKWAKKSTDITAALQAPRIGHGTVELSKRSDLRKKLEKSTRPSQQSKDRDYSKPMTEEEKKLAKAAAEAAES